MTAKTTQMTGNILFYGEGVNFTVEDLGYDLDTEWKIGDSIKVPERDDEHGDHYLFYVIHEFVDDPTDGPTARVHYASASYED